MRQKYDLQAIEIEIEMLIESAHSNIDLDCLLEHGLSDRELTRYNALCNRRDKLKSEDK